jgi:hypothetical protein
MTIVALFFGPSSTGYTPGDDQFNYDHAQYVAQGYVDGGECVNGRRIGAHCKGNGVSVNDSGCCAGCSLLKRRRDDGADFASDDDQANAAALPVVSRKKPKVKVKNGGK